MSFFGIRWLPQKEGNFKISESDPIEMSKFVSDIRCNGRNAAQENYAKSHQEYENAYYNYIQLKDTLLSKKKYLDEAMISLDEDSKTLIKDIAKYMIEKDPRYNILVKDLDVNRKNILDMHYIPYLELKKQLNDNENLLWIKRASLQAFQKVYDVWSFEYTAAKNYTKELEETLNIEKKENYRRLEERDNRYYKNRKKNYTKHKEKKSTNILNDFLLKPNRETSEIDTSTSFSSKNSKKEQKESVKTKTNYLENTNIFFKFLDKKSTEEKETKVSGYDWL